MSSAPSGRRGKLHTGQVLEGSRLACDYWRRSARPGLLHFLSHAHSDHMSGLSAAFDRPVFCSPLTAALLPNFVRLRPALLRPLELDVWHEIPYPPGGPPGSVFVQLLDAHHCPGSVMFHFHGPELGRLLYTGDFRFDAAHPVFRAPPYVQLFDGLKFDCVYLDNTYLPVQDANSLPSREALAKEIVDMVAEELASRPNSLVIIPTYRLGKEDLLHQVAASTGQRVGAEEERARVLVQAGVPRHLLCSEPGDPSLRLLTVHSQRLPPTVNRLKKERPLFVIIPSALHLSRNVSKFAWTRRYTQDDDENVRIKFVSYTDHSSGQEIEDFMSHLKVRKVVPISAEMTPTQRSRFINLEPRTDSITNLVVKERCNVATAASDGDAPRPNGIMKPSSSLTRLDTLRSPRKGGRRLHNPASNFAESFTEPPSESSSCSIVSLPSPPPTRAPKSELAEVDDDDEDVEVLCEIRPKKAPLPSPPPPPLPSSLPLVFLSKRERALLWKSRVADSVVRLETLAPQPRPGDSVRDTFLRLIAQPKPKRPAQPALFPE